MMTLRRITVTLGALLGLVPWTAAHAQRLAPVPIPGLQSGRDDLEEVDESEEPSSPEAGAELSLSQEEKRSRHFYSTAIGVGGVKPWQSYTLEFQYLAYANAAYGLYAGTGQIHDTGILDERSYDMKLRARSAGFSFRYHPTSLGRLSIDGSLAFATWDGRLVPQGSDDEERAPEDRLSTTFQASGAVLSTSVVLSWIWDSGVFLEWTPLGAYKSKLLTHDFSRGSASVENAVVKKIESAQIFGLTNIKVGYLF